MATTSHESLQFSQIKASCSSRGEVWGTARLTASAGQVAQLLPLPLLLGLPFQTEGCGSTLNSWAFPFKALKSVGDETETFNRPLDPAGVRAAGQGLFPGSLLHLTELSVFTGPLQRQPLSYLTTS